MWEPRRLTILWASTLCYRLASPLLSNLRQFVSKKKFWEELIACIHLVLHGRHGKRLVQQFVAAVTFVPSRCLATMGRIHI
jgi:hypothetical protein